MYLFVDIQQEDAGTLECNVLQKIWEKNRLVRYDSVAKLPFSIQVRGKNPSVLSFKNLSKLRYGKMHIYIDIFKFAFL